MSMIVWILLGFVLGLIVSRIVSTTGEGTVVDILLGIFGGGGATGFNIDTVHSAGLASLGAIIILALYHAFLRRRML
jgi:uncharacterized membrane protein YeaQ/YmgE (transglycosylase-associated protein family)